MSITNRGVDAVAPLSESQRTHSLIELDGVVDDGWDNVIRIKPAKRFYDYNHLGPNSIFTIL